MIEILAVVTILLLCIVGFAVKRKASTKQESTPSLESKNRVAASTTQKADSDLYSDQIESNEAIEIGKVESETPSLEVNDGEVDYRSKVEKSADNCWIPPGNDIVIDGNNVKGGMIYIKGFLSKKNENAVEVIDLKLKRDSSGTYFKEYNLYSWDSYSNISPKARGAYINWLTDGRPIDGVQVGYINLFYSGLERRVLCESPGNDELESIASEVKRLMADCRYDIPVSGYASFCNRAKKFLKYIKLEIDGWEHDPIIDYNCLGKEVFPVTFVMALGRMIDNKKPLPWELALEWSLRHLKNNIRKPAKQCPSELALLFKTKYLEKFGEGLVVSQYNKREIVLYYPENSSIEKPIVKLSDASELLDTCIDLRLIIDSCLDQLDSLSRFKSKVSLSEHTLMSYALLPYEIIDEFEPKNLNQLRHICEVSFKDRAEIASVSIDSIIDLWLPSNKRMSQTDSQLLAVVLDRIGYGMEPDVRHKRPLKTVGEGICIFRSTNNNESAPTTNFRQALVVAHLSALVAFANGKSNHGRKYILDQLKLFLSLDSTEEIRMTAYFEWVLEYSQSLTGLKPLVDELDESKRNEFASFLLGIIGSNGVIHSDEISMLEKAYKTLGMNSADVQNNLHRLLAMDESQPVVVKEAICEDHNHAIPNVLTVDAPSSVELNEERLRARKKQTLEVVRLLDEIFVDEEFEPEQRLEESTVFDLDSIHMQLLRRLSEKDFWDHATFENLADEYGLLPSGALETINDAALDNFDDEVLFDGEEIKINRDIIERMLS
jgi:hypothetical protein